MDFKVVSADDILKLRHKVLRENKPLSTAHFEGDNLDTTFHFAALTQNKIVGCVSLIPVSHEDFDELNPYQLRGMAVDPQFQGQHIGNRLLDFTSKQLLLRKINFVWCNVRTSAIEFYAKNNFIQNGEIFEISNVGPHILMFKFLH